MAKYQSIHVSHLDISDPPWRFPTKTCRTRMFRTLTYRTRTFCMWTFRTCAFWTLTVQIWTFCLHTFRKWHFTSWYIRSLQLNISSPCVLYISCLDISNPIVSNLAILAPYLKHTEDISDTFGTWT